MPIEKTGQSQVEKFRDAARALEADNSEEAFDAALRKIAGASTGKESSAKVGRVLKDKGPLSD